MEAIYGHDLRTTTICTYFQSPINTRLHMKFEDLARKGGRVREVVQRCTDDGLGVITIAHPDLR